MFEYPEDNPEQRKKRAAKHAKWLKAQQADQLHDARVEAVRVYLQNRNQFTGGPDLPNWKQPHELWYQVRIIGIR